MWLEVSGSGFADGEPFPDAWRLRSPALEWREPRPDVESFVVVLEDIEARPARVHWCVFDIAKEARSLAANLGRRRERAGQWKQATNDLGVVGYSGPASSPTGGRRFALRLFGVARVLGLVAGSPCQQVIAAMTGKVKQLSSVVALFEPR